MEDFRRQIFLYQQRLEGVNEDLKSRLQLAENALAFEKPTEQENMMVRGVMAEQADGEALKFVMHIPFEHLELHERIGAGAFGEVIKTTYAGRTVAVKRIIRSRIDNATIRAMFLEIIMCSRLRHPNIVWLVGASWNNTANLCIVLEHVPRGSLGSLLGNEERGSGTGGGESLDLSWTDPKLRMLKDVVSGLAFLHAQPLPIIHRDLKTDNVLVTSTFSCKLADFGASVQFNNNTSMTTAGTVTYMAPEVYIGAPYDTKADIFSLGILIWSLHTQKYPYFDCPAWSVVQVLNGLRPHLPPDVPHNIARLAEACWAHEPNDRPSAQQVQEQLQHLDPMSLRPLDVLDGGGGGGGLVAAVGCDAGDDDDDDENRIVVLTRPPGGDGA